MTRGISEVTDEHGVTHYVRGAVKFIREPRNRRKRNSSKQGRYVTLEGCSWWCTYQPVPARSLASPGREVNCMTCLVHPPGEPPPPLHLEGVYTGRISSNKANIWGTPSYGPTQVFDVKTRSTRSFTTVPRSRRRR